MKKKGFTLIELLGVIVILAIISLIAVPIVLNIINSSKLKTLENSSRQLIKAAKLYYQEQDIDGAIKEEKIFIFPETEELDIKGNLPESGTMKINSYGEIALAVSDGTHCVKKEYTDKDITTNKNIDECEISPEPNEPVITSGLIAITIDENGAVKKADTDIRWYDYNNQEWANAVSVTSTTRNMYDSATAGTTISKEDILAYYVWIPKYEYKIEGTYGMHIDGTVGTKELPGEIKVKFMEQETTKESKGYKAHPAFTFDEEQVSGIWVGKFEISHTTLSSTTSNNLNCSTETCTSADGIRILPDVISLRNNNISNFFYAIRSMSRSGNAFGLYKNEIDTHMMKNSEWGAVAYLTQSKYGKYGNADYTGSDKEVYINNSSSYYTGRSGGSYGGNTAINTVYKDQTSKTQYNGYGFYTYDGYLLEYNSNTKTTTRNLQKMASTTGNITGIYDMSGGTWEYVMGVFANSDGVVWSGNSESENSGFTGKIGSSADDYEGTQFPDEKYYDIYKASSGTTIRSTTACNGGICYGHALSETPSWYNDYDAFVSIKNLWLGRGGDYNDGNTTGIFFSGAYKGNSFQNVSTRVVLLPL